MDEQKRALMDSIVEKQRKFKLMDDIVAARKQAEVAPQQGDAVGGLVGKFGSGMTFGINDELTAGLFAPTRALGNLIAGKEDASIGGAYDSLLAEQRRNLKKAEEEYPIGSIVTELGGGLTTGLAGAGTKFGKFVGGKAAQGIAPAATSTVGKLGNFASRAGIGAGAAGASGAAYGFGSGEGTQGRMEGAKESGMVGAAIGGSLPIAGAGLSAVKGAVFPKVSGNVAELAKRARDFGIPLSVSQVAPTRFRSTVQKVSQEVPFSGVDSFEDAARGKWNQALAKTLGQTSDDLSPSTIQSFAVDNSAKFDNALKGEVFNFGEADRKAIEAIKSSASEALSADLQPTVAKNIDIALETIGNGRISGEKLASLRSRLLKNSTGAKNQASSYIGDAIKKIDDIIEKGSTAEKRAVLQEARKEYRNFKTIQPLLEKSTDGTINPTQLLDRVAANKYINASKTAVGEDDLVDLARIGKEFLPKQGGSDTMQKAAAALGGKTVLTGAAAMGDLGITAGGLGINRLFQKGYNQNQKLIDALLKDVKPQAGRSNEALNKVRARILRENIMKEAGGN